MVICLWSWLSSTDGPDHWPGRGQGRGHVWGQGGPGGQSSEHPEDLHRGQEGGGQPRSWTAWAGAGSW